MFDAYSRSTRTARDALNALMNAALMAGENVSERIACTIFVKALDLVVHVDRDDVVREDDRVRRQVSEIAAVVPGLGNGMRTDPSERTTRDHSSSTRTYSAASGSSRA